MAASDSGFTISDLFTPLTPRRAVQIIIVAGLLVYFNMLFNGFVWDDLTYIIGNQELEGFRLTNLFGQNMFNSSGYFRPIPAVYFSLLYNIFGRSSFFYHFFQLVLHITSASLLFFIYQKFFTIKPALFLSLFFLVHPINVESVSYIGSTQSQLYFLFGGLALFFNFADRISPKRALIIHLFFALALFTKEVSVLYLLLIYIYRLFFHRAIPRIYPWLTGLTLAGYLLVRISVLDTFLHRMEMIPISEISTPDRLLHIPAVFFYYLKTFFFPGVLAINQIWTISEFNIATFYFPLFAVLIFLTACLLFGQYLHRRRHPAGRSFLFFLVWFLAGMAFLLQIFPLDMTVADRWFYFPVVGLLGVLGLVFAELVKILPRVGKSFWLWLAVAMLSLLSVRTMVRNADWHDALTLYSRDADKFDNYDLQNNLGAELAFSGDFPSALPHFLESVRLLPHDTNLYNAGMAYERLGYFEQAISFYRRAIELETDFPRHAQVIELSTVGLGRLLVLHQSPGQASDFLRTAVETYPENGTLWAFFAISLYDLNQYAPALSAAETARTLLPNPTANKLYNLILNRQKIDLRLE